MRFSLIDWNDKGNYISSSSFNWHVNEGTVILFHVEKALVMLDLLEMVYLSPTWHIPKRQSWVIFMITDFSPYEQTLDSNTHVNCASTL